MKNQNHAQEHTDSQCHKPHVRTCKPCSFTRLCLYWMLVNKTTVFKLWTKTKPKTGKLVNVFSWVKKSTESQSDPSVSHHTAEYCKAAGGGKEKEGTITECLRTSVYPWVWWHQTAIPGELWVWQDSRKDIAGTHFDPAVLEEQYSMKAHRSCERHNDLQQEGLCLPWHPDTPGT